MIESLINKLSGAEKRYHVMMSSVFRSQANHLSIFKSLESDISPLEKNSLSGRKGAIKRRYLKDALLDNLRTFHRKRSIGRIIMNLMQDAELYYEKLLFKECLKTLKKAKKLASRHERFGLHLEIIGWERRLLGSTLEKHNISETEIDEEERVILLKNGIDKRCRKMQARVFEFKKKYGFLDKTRNNQLKGLVPDIVNFNKEKINSNRALFYYNWTMALYHSMMAEHEKSYYYSRSIDDRFLDVVDPEDLVYGMLEHLTSCIYTHRYKEVLNGISLMERLLALKNFNDIMAIEQRMFYYRANYLLISLAALGRTKELKSHLNDLEEELKNNRERIPNPMMYVLRSTIGQIYFILGKFETAKHFCRETLAYPKNAVRQDVMDNFRILYPCVLLELDEIELLESELNSNIKYFHKQQKNYPFEIKITRSFLKMLGGKKTDRFSLYKEIQSAFEKKFSLNTGTIYFDDLIIYQWSRHRLNGISQFSELVPPSLG